MTTEQLEQKANETILKVYNKIKNSDMLHIEKQKILANEFDSNFVFIEFFSKEINYHKNISYYKSELLADLVDIIELNEGKITIQELVSIIKDINLKTENDQIPIETKEEEIVDEKYISDFDILNLNQATKENKIINITKG